MNLRFRITWVAVCVLSLLACGSTESDADAENAAQSEPAEDGGAKLPSSGEQDSGTKRTEAPDPREAEELAAKWLDAAKQGDVEYLVSITETSDAAATRKFYEKVTKDFSKRSYKLSVEKAFTKPELLQWMPKWLAQIGEIEEYKEDAMKRGLEKFGDQDLFVVVLDRSKAGLKQAFPTLVFRGSGSDLKFVEFIK